MLSKKKKYLQVALNSSLSEAYSIIHNLPPSDRILIEAGTPLIKTYGSEGISSIFSWWSQKVTPLGLTPYVVADLKCMDRGATEVLLAKNAGASAAIALGFAPVETIDAFIETCRLQNIDSMLDMMNMEYPVKYLRMLKKLPTVVLLHRGVDEIEFNKSKPIPYIQINKIRSSFNTMISIAGGDTIREVQRGVFNGADIVVVWKEFYQSSGQTGALAEEFLRQIK
jgi:bifunctional enzyme Fae/Hps